MTTSSRTEVRPSQSARVAQTAADRANTSRLDLAIISESYRCQYPSKHCIDDRSVKRDGDLHKFCEFHRSKANRNQRKLEQKRKLENKSPIARKIVASPRYQRPRGSSSSGRSSLLSRSSRSSEAGLADQDDSRTPWDMLLPIDLAEHDIQALVSLFEATDN